MIQFSSLVLRRGHKLLFENATFSIHTGQKIGITGRNGTGKSSLFKLILGEIQADEGSLEFPKNWVISHVAQETPALDRTAIDLVMDGDAELRRLQADLSVAEAADDGAKQGEIFAQLEAIDGFQARTRAAKLMQGLGFSIAQENEPVKNFSGGWRMRLNLAQALMCRSDLLLLDEPTNHLDLDAVFWLEEWLASYRGTLLMISHDRDVLDRTVDGIAHIEQQTMQLTPGNYSAFERIRAERLAQQQAEFVRQQREREYIHKFVERFRAKATKAKQVQSRIKALEKMELIAPAHVDSPFHFQFREPEKLPFPLLTIENAAAGYRSDTDETQILDEVSMVLNPGDRLALLGRNGAGKSTLMKLIAGNSVQLAGNRKEAKHLHIGYFAQHQLEQLDLEASAAQHLQRLEPDTPEQEIRDYFGSFGFHSDRVLEPVVPFSGGEKARLVLALIIRQHPNLLLLDEPTNHLDLEMRHALVMALQEFTGALVVVSHDRFLLEGTADQFLLVADGRIAPYDDNLDSYAQWLRSGAEKSEKTDSTTNTKNVDSEITTEPVNKKEQRKLEAEKRKALAPLKKKISQLENSVEKLEVRQKELEEQLAQPEIYEDSEKEKLKAVLQEKLEVDKKLEEEEEQLLGLYGEI